MSDNPRHRSRRRRKIQVELLETRALLSTFSVYSPGIERFLQLTPSSEYVNQQEGAFTVTLTLTKLNGQMTQASLAYKAAALDEPETVDFSASLEAPGAAGTAAASPIFAPFNESVTFPAGASTETVTVPIISSAATPGPVTIWLSATPPSDSPVSSFGPANTIWVPLYSSPDAVPPAITSVQLVTHGKLASAVVLGFNQPMAPATVEKIQNYRILSRPISDFHSSFLFGLFGGGSGSETTERQSFPIAAATYDPSTRAVTLTLKRPAKASSLYDISSAYPIKGHQLTDLEGQPLAQSTIPTAAGAFTIAVRPALGSATSSAGPLKSTTQLGWDF